MSKRPFSECLITSDNYYNPDLNEKQVVAVKSCLDAVFENSDRDRAVFITGPGGTGKSMVLEEVVRVLKHNGVSPAVTATTANAARLVNGVTINSFAGIGKGDKPLTDIMKDIYNKPYLMKRWKKTDVLIIDEISLLNDLTFNLLDSIGRRTRKRSELFGRMSLILFGDFLQLPPVTGNPAFMCPAWKEIGRNIILSENMRARKCALSEQFSRILEAVRVGNVTEEVVNFFQSRLMTDTNKPPEGVRLTKIYSKNHKVDEINSQEMARLVNAQNPLKQFHCRVSFMGGTENARAATKARLLGQPPAVNTLELCVGARVVMIANVDAKRGLVNGALGTVMEFSTVAPYHPIVKFDALNSVIKVTPHTWEESMGDKTCAYYHQLPLRLAWCLSIHKCQGMTLDYILADLGLDTFAAGMFYVAVSRAKNPLNLFLADFDPKAIKTDDKIKKFYEEISATDEPRDP